MTGMATAYWLRKCGVEGIVVLERRDGLAHGDKIRFMVIKRVTI